MLSRVAENLYWLGRYLERAENTARLIQVTTHLQLDLPTTVKTSWTSLLDIFAIKSLFDQYHEESDERSVLRFLLVETSNPGSICSSLRLARENARSIRDILPQSGWEKINHLYQYSESEGGKGIYKKHRFDTLEHIISSIQEINGCLQGTMLHDAGYQFLCIGSSLERADMTSRIVDVQTEKLLPTSSDHAVHYENLQWMSVLKSVSAYENYRRASQQPINHKTALNFLFKDKTFPRSVAFCLQNVEHCAWNLGNGQKLITEARSVRLFVADANCSKRNEDLHKFVDDLQKSLTRINARVLELFF